MIRSEFPAVSVVTAVRDGRRYLLESLNSILEQQDVEFEAIVVDDGSTDGTSELLSEIVRRDGRVRVIRQEAAGLTRALIEGCQQARGEFIARHDADDLSLPSRLSTQLRMLRACPDRAMVGCWGYGIGPRGETLFEMRRPSDPRIASDALTRQVEGPTGHGSVMFRADAYRRVGGYRTAFRYAQDWDLWLRLIEVGDMAYAQAYLYAYRVDAGSISAERRGEQRELAALAGLCHDARVRGESDAHWVSQAALIGCADTRPTRRRTSASSYFVGKCLLDRRDRRAMHYLGRTVKANPLHLKAWLALGIAAVRAR
jgi:glycosyltransferase involved in cell wall biosynthesis